MGQKYEEMQEKVTWCDHPWFEYIWECIQVTYNLRFVVREGGAF